MGWAELRFFKESFTSLAPFIDTPYKFLFQVDK